MPSDPLVLGSVISIFYYLRVIVAMYMRPEEAAQTAPIVPRVSILAGATLTALVVIVLWLGIWPAPVLEIIRTAVESL